LQDLEIGSAAVQKIVKTPYFRKTESIAAGEVEAFCKICPFWVAV
jgi:hypothetical protein